VDALDSGTTNVVPTQKDRPLHSSKRKPYFKNMYIYSRREQKSWSWISIRLEARNDSAGKYQQQFNLSTD
jgi:hypothetical protein